MKNVARALFAGGIAAIGLATEGCSSQATSPEATSACDEFPGSVGAAPLDPDTTVLLNATVSLVNLANNVEVAVLNGCVGIDADLMVSDTWTAKGPVGGGSADAEVTEACTQASRAIAAALSGAGDDAGVQPPCALSVSGGGCRVDPTVQATCVAACTGGASCAPPTVTADCPPAAITGLCRGACVAG